MDILQFFVSVNKISLVAFTATFAFLAYELYFLYKKKQKENTPVIPQFDPSKPMQTLQSSATVKNNDFQQNKSSLHIILVVLLVIALIGFGGITFFSTLGGNTSSSSPNIVIQEVKSKGIKFFNNDWKELLDKDFIELQPGTSVIISVETIPEANIDRARIRINESGWTINHITTKFNNRYNVFYTEYIISTAESKLRVEAQLHSPQDGWLGD